jgi:hypothetical protein
VDGGELLAAPDDNGVDDKMGLGEAKSEAWPSRSIASSDEEETRLEFGAVSVIFGSR